MSKQLVAYLIVYFFAVLYAFKPNFLKNINFSYVYFFVFLIVSILVRSTIGEIPSQDIDKYSFLMTQELGLPNFNKEFVYWYGSKYLYMALGEQYLVFIFMDLAIFTFVFMALNSIRDFSFRNYIQKEEIRFLFFLVFLFFPFVQGYNVIYRQLLASVIVLFSISTFASGYRFKGSLAFFVAFFIHNSSGVFLPLLFFLSGKRYLKILALFSLISLPFIFNFVTSSDNPYIYRSLITTFSGSTINYFYLIFFIAFLIFATLVELNVFNFSRSDINNNIQGILLMICIYLFFIFYTSSGLSERIAYYLFLVFFPYITMYFLSCFRFMPYPRIFLIHLAILPLFISHNSTISL